MELEPSPGGMGGRGGHCPAGPGISEEYNGASSRSVASTETNCHCQSEEPLLC